MSLSTDHKSYLGLVVKIKSKSYDTGTYGTGNYFIFQDRLIEEKETYKTETDVITEYSYIYFDKPESNNMNDVLKKELLVEATDIVQKFNKINSKIKEEQSETISYFSKPKKNV